MPSSHSECFVFVPMLLDLQPVMDLFSPSPVGSVHNTGTVKLCRRSQKTILHCITLMSFPPVDTR
ncbi:hypothetical protein EYF80_005573 [Liparis tanakae]|uniref:Uncharacterized protein n=1 Tax=Liparis tanakae TaxID=230148 RepID=A0A4Z2J237_9TELE|nr:hypothetical protein EYF80_005573 [Liparis tanakae]